MKVQTLEQTLIYFFILEKSRFPPKKFYNINYMVNCRKRRRRPSMLTPSSDWSRPWTLSAKSFWNTGSTRREKTAPDSIAEWARRLGKSEVNLKIWKQFRRRRLRWILFQLNIKLLTLQTKIGFLFLLDRKDRIFGNLTHIGFDYRCSIVIYNLLTWPNKPFLN